MILSNTESLDQYRFGNGIAEIMSGGQAQISHREEEILLSAEELKKYTGTYLPGKIWMEEKNGKLYLIRVNQNIHIELYCIGKNRFKRRWEEQEYVHELMADGAQKPSVWGYERVSTQFL